MGATPSFFVEKINQEPKLTFELFMGMSREEFKNFVTTVEHNIHLKKELLQCKSSQDLISFARKYGYSITLKDLDNDKTDTKFESWFDKSKINPLK